WRAGGNASAYGPCGPSLCTARARNWPRAFDHGGKSQWRDAVSAEKSQWCSGTAMTSKHLQRQHRSASREPCWEGNIGRQLLNSVFQEAHLAKGPLLQAAAKPGLQADFWPWPTHGVGMSLSQTTFRSFPPEHLYHAAYR